MALQTFQRSRRDESSAVFYLDDYQCFREYDQKAFLCEKYMKRVLLVFLMIIIPVWVYAQPIDCSKGLLIMPSAEMEESGTFVISNNFLNKHYTTDKGGFGWTYHTFSYGFGITFWSRLEVTYICTIFNGAWRPEDPSTLTERQRIVRNQDRHFAARFQLVRENETGRMWVPSVVLGCSDPVTASSGGEYIGSDVSESGNGFFNRYYIAASKHFHTVVGDVGTHAAYQYTFRKDFLSSGPCVGLTWDPVWLNVPDNFLTSFRAIAEFDSKNINFGVMGSVWNNHIEAWMCLEGCRWLNAGIRYKVVL